ncbi:MAG: triple tyrosine motif-containing protein, partial [Bacteroidota bacterium]
MGLLHADIADLNGGLFKGGEEQKTPNGLEGQAKFISFNYSDGFIGMGCNRGAMLLDSRNRLWVGAVDRLTVMNTNRINWNVLEPKTEIYSVELFNERVDWRAFKDSPDTSLALSNRMRVSDIEIDDFYSWYQLPVGLSLPYRNNYITLNYNANSLYQSENIVYKHMLVGLEQDWSVGSLQRGVTYSDLAPGSYTFKVMSRYNSGLWSEPAEFSFVIRPPIWRTWWAYLIFSFVTIGTFLFWLRWRERALRKRQSQLEMRVRNATQSLRIQKVEAERQKNYADSQRELAESQRVIIEQRNRETLDSIEYAKRIQHAILPPFRWIKEYLTNSF